MRCASGDCAGLCQRVPQAVQVWCGVVWGAAGWYTTHFGFGRVSIAAGVGAGVPSSGRESEKNGSCPSKRSGEAPVFRAPIRMCTACIRI